MENQPRQKSVSQIDIEQEIIVSQEKEIKELQDKIIELKTKNVLLIQLYINLKNEKP